MRLLLLACLMLSAAVHARDLQLMFVGDLMLAERPGELIRQGRDPFAEFAPLFREADLTIGNLECTVAHRGTAEPKPYTFRAHPRVLSVLKKHFDAVSLANNHSGDFGPQAFAEMLTHLDQAGLPYFGGGKNLREAHRPWIVKRHGKTIAILGYNEFFPRSFEALPDRAGIAWSDDDQVVFDIQQAKTRDQADIVIVYPHWGWEYEKTHSPRQQQLAHRMIDAGADVVIGGHPHVTQDIETYRGKPIFYSLGNFVFNGFNNTETTTGWALQLRISPESTFSWTIYPAKIDRDGVPRLQKPLPQESH